MRQEPSPYPQRVIRGQYDEQTITVYQAYGNRIADRALAAGTLVAPFRLDRMTWIKPSFCWMMYRSRWATRESQERVLAIHIDRHGFEWALANGSLSHYDPHIHADQTQWRDQQRISPVRIQWDPDRSVDLQLVPYRAIQIGLSGVAVHRYVSNWIAGIDDITALAQQIGALVAGNDLGSAGALLPAERPYPVPL